MRLRPEEIFEQDEDHKIDSEAIIVQLLQPQLGEDEINIVLNYLYLDEYYNPPQLWKHFSQYSLIARGWRHPAQTLLFRHISLNTPLIYRIDKKLLYSTYLPFLLLRVRILSLADSQLNCQPSCEPNTSPYNALCHAMSLCPFLYELRLEWMAPAPNKAIIEALRRTPPIAVLRLTVIHLVAPVLVPFLTCWPLRHLFITAKSIVPITAAESEALSSTIPILHLEELGLNAPRFAPSHPAFEWILQRTSHSLQILHLDGVQPIYPSKSPLLLSHLVSLTLTDYKLLGIVPELTSLIEMAISVDERIWTYSSIEHCFQRLPSSLRYLRIKFCPLNKHDCWSEVTKRFLRFIRAQVVRGGRPWQLEQVTCEGSTNRNVAIWCPSEGAMADYRRQFSALGTRLVFEQASYKDYDAVPFCGYPRDDILTNMTTMNRIVNDEKRIAFLLSSFN